MKFQILSILITDYKSEFILTWTERLSMDESQHSLPYLVHRIVARIEASANKRAKKYGLRVQGVRVLRRLNDCDHQRVGELAGNTSIEPSALSHLIKRMARDGWIVRRRDPGDDRTVIVSLTEDGRRLVATTLGPIFEHYDEICWRGFDAKEQKRIRAALVRIYANIENLDDEVQEWETAHINRSCRKSDRR